MPSLHSAASSASTRRTVVRCSRAYRLDLRLQHFRGDSVAQTLLRAGKELFIGARRGAPRLRVENEIFLFDPERIHGEDKRLRKSPVPDDWVRMVDAVRIMTTTRRLARITIVLKLAAVRLAVCAEPVSAWSA
jgi:hypothetical protein